MPSVTYQLVYNQDIESIREHLLDKIKEFSEDYPGFIERDQVLKINYNKKLSEKSFLICFTLNFRDIDLIEQNLDDEGKLAEDVNTEEKIYNKREEIEENLKILIQGLTNSFKDDDSLILIKSNDCSLLYTFKDYYSEIFEIEMELREVVTFIFSVLYPLNLLNFTDMQKWINTKLKYEGYPSKEEKLKDLNQNDIFYLLFSQYRGLKINDFVNLEEIKIILEKFGENEPIPQEEIKSLGIMSNLKNKFQTFLTEINPDLDSIEKLRNCVAHNREPTQDEIQNYLTAKEQLKEKIRDFRKEVFYPIIVSATIYLENPPNLLGVWRQNSTTLEFESGDQEEIDFGDMFFFADLVEETYPQVKEELLNYLVKKFYNFNEEEIDINFEFVS